jgi:hypothetical protein
VQADKTSVRNYLQSDKRRICGLDLVGSNLTSLVDEKREITGLEGPVSIMDL